MCENWVHKACTGIRESQAKATNFIRKSCQGLRDKNVDETIQVNSEEAKTVDRFSYLRDVLGTQGKYKKL